jgi:hypothetical protein
MGLWRPGVASKDDQQSSSQPSGVPSPSLNRLVPLAVAIATTSSNASSAGRCAPRSSRSCCSTRGCWLRLSLRAGLHTGECELIGATWRHRRAHRRTGDGQPACRRGAGLQHRQGPGVGSGIGFGDRGSHRSRASLAAGASQSTTPSRHPLLPARHSNGQLRRSRKVLVVGCRGPFRQRLRRSRCDAGRGGTPRLDTPLVSVRVADYRRRLSGARPVHA